MSKVLLVYLAMAIGFVYIAIQDEKIYKNIRDGYKPNAKDGDNDGIIQEGTKWERKAK